MPIINDHSEDAKSGMQEAIARALEAIGLQAESYAKLELENAPRRIDTGNLRNSISHNVNEEEQTVYIGTNVEYGVYVHEGTDRMEKNRFLRNAVEKNSDQYKEMLKSYIKS